MKETQVLIVDDDQNVLKYLTRILGSESYGLVTTSSPDEALSVLSKEPIKVVLSDQGMPAVSGLELINRIRGKNPKILGILFTGDTDQKNARNALARGDIYHYLEKPCRDLELKVVLRQAIEKYDLEEENRRLSSEIQKSREIPQVPKLPSEAELQEHKTVLIVDDDQHLVGLMKYHFQETGYSVVTAPNGKEGLDCLKVIKPDLIVLDVNMPEMNGIEFFGHIITKHGYVKYPVLVLTTRANLEDMFKGIDAAGFLPKPFKVEELVAEVRRILSQDFRSLVYILDFDESEHTGGIAGILSEEQFEVVCFSDISRFESKVAFKKPKYIILEFQPGEGATTYVIKKIKESGTLKDVLVLVYSYADVEDFKRKSLEAGADKFLNRPENYGVFVRALKELEMRQEGTV